MRTTRIPADPRALPEPEGAEIEAVPAPRWRMAAAWAIDYMAFSVLWALGVRFLVPGPPPPGWVVPPIFLVFELIFVRHWRTPGTWTMDLVPIRPVPGHSGPASGGPGETGRVLWLTPAELARRENPVSVIVGLLFIMVGLKLWALALGDYYGLPPGLADIRWPIGMVVTLWWGGLWMWIGRAFLWLLPLTRVAGVAMLIACMAFLSFWPEAWGAWFATALAGRQADFSHTAPAAHLEWVRIWFPVAAWALCAFAAVVITVNVGPFRNAPETPTPAAPAPPAPGRADPAHGQLDRPRERFDMPVDRAAQVTALVMLLGILAGWSFNAWSDAWGAGLDRDSRTLVETALPRIAAEWDPEALAAVASGDLKDALAQGTVQTAFTRYARLGALVSVDDVTGESVVRFLPEGVEVSAHYSVEARFAQGPAHIQVLLLRQGDRWTVSHFQIASPALARRP